MRQKDFNEAIQEAGWEINFLFSGMTRRQYDYQIEKEIDDSINEKMNELMYKLCDGLNAKILVDFKGITPDGQKVLNEQ